MLLDAVTRRLRADVPVVSYLSGGVDSSIVVAMASQVRGSPIPCFTIRIKAPRARRDERGRASSAATSAPSRSSSIAAPRRCWTPIRELIRAAEGPVIDTSCAALLLLAREVHDQGFKVALTGEGADEWLAGYPWHKINRAARLARCHSGLPLSQLTRPLARRLGCGAAGDSVGMSARAGGGRRPQRLARHLRPDEHGQAAVLQPGDERSELADHVPYEDLGIPRRAGMSRWHPLNRELYLSGRCHLAGPAAQRQGRPRGDELLGRDALSVSR